MAFTILLALGLHLACDASEVQRQQQPHQQDADAALVDRFSQLASTNIKGLDGKRLKLLRVSVIAFEKYIDQSNLEPEQKKAAKQLALDHFATRLAAEPHPQTVGDGSN